MVQKMVDRYKHSLHSWGGGGGKYIPTLLESSMNIIEVKLVDTMSFKSPIPLLL